MPARSLTSPSFEHVLSGLTSQPNALRRTDETRTIGGSWTPAPVEESGADKVESSPAANAAARVESAALAQAGRESSWAQARSLALESAGKVVTRIGALARLYQDENTAIPSRADYDREFAQLKSQLSDVQSSYFRSDPADDSSRRDRVAFVDTLVGQSLGLLTGAPDLATLTSETLDHVSSQVALAQANAGAILKDVTAEAEHLARTPPTSSEPAADAAEATLLARTQILQEAGDAIAAQVNVSRESVLALLEPAAVPTRGPAESLHPRPASFTDAGAGTAAPPRPATSPQEAE